MATQTTLYNNALKILGETKLSSITEAREPRYALDDAYADVVQFALESGQWWFARREASIAADATAPSFGFSWRFAKPADWVRTMALSSDERFLCPLEYSDQPAWWYANTTPVFLAYVSNNASYGTDLTKWPPSFTRFVEYELAGRTSKQITGREPDEEFAKRWEKAKRNALNKDAMNDSQPKPQPSGSFVRSRGASGQYAGRYVGGIYYR